MEEAMDALTVAPYSMSKETKFWLSPMCSSFKERDMLYKSIYFVSLLMEHGTTVRASMASSIIVSFLRHVVRSSPASEESGDAYGTGGGEAHPPQPSRFPD
ncbi:hypothetical protein COP2_017938 [Malus domestica]